MMIIFWIATSALLAYLYHHFCDNLAGDAECDETDERFIATPVLGFICFVGWVSNFNIYDCIKIDCNYIAFYGSACISHAKIYM